MNQTTASNLIIGGIVLFFVALFGFALIKPYYEAQVFNKFSPVKATYFDAVFADLRIEACRQGTQP